MLTAILCYYQILVDSSRRSMQMSCFSKVKNIWILANGTSALGYKFAVNYYSDFLTCCLKHVVFH